MSLPPAPTPAMIDFFHQRTAQHIERVRRSLKLMAGHTEHAQALYDRARMHDLSKFGSHERLGYIWVTEYHRHIRQGRPFEYPPGVPELAQAAMQHHYRNNRHHHEFHADPNEMLDVDLIEMVCDWTAMAQEFGEADGSARSWANKVIGTRCHLQPARHTFVLEMITLLDRCLADQPPGATKTVESALIPLINDFQGHLVETLGPSGRHDELEVNRLSQFANSMPAHHVFEDRRLIQWHLNELLDVGYLVEITSHGHETKFGFASLQF
ncbi:MAG: hypothetical protein IT423_12235 [Pirellulaceae bacterium]|nr:hypothetical protein [Pirellulaceae bacterium]